MLIADTIPSIAIQSIAIRACTADRRAVTKHVPVNHAKKRGTAIHQLTARLILSDLNMTWNQRQSLSTRQDIDEKAQQFACKWGVLSKWTSFFLSESDESRDFVNRCSHEIECRLWHPVDTALDRKLSLSFGPDIVPEGVPVAVPAGMCPRDSPPPRGQPLEIYCFNPLHDDHVREKSPAVSTSCQPSSKTNALSFDLFPLDSTRNSAKRKYNIAAKTRAKAGIKTSPIAKPKRRCHGHKQYIDALLSRQDFKGSFSFNKLDAEYLLGDHLAFAIEKVVKSSSTPSKVIFTAAIVIILEREFQQWKGFWDLMHTKAVGYLQEYDGGKGYNRSELARELDGFHVDVEERLKALQAASFKSNEAGEGQAAHSQAPSSTPTEVSHVDGSQTGPSSSQRVLLDRVPAEM